MSSFLPRHRPPVPHGTLLGSSGSPFYIHDCTISVGDDNIAGHANDTLVEDCAFGTGHGASIGSLSSGITQNVTFRRITFNGTVQAMRVKTDVVGRGWASAPGPHITSAAV